MTLFGHGTGAESARNARKHKARGVSPGERRQLGRARGAGGRCINGCFFVGRIFDSALYEMNKDISRTTVARSAGDHISGAGSWG